MSNFSRDRQYIYKWHVEDGVYEDVPTTFLGDRKGVPWFDIKGHERPIYDEKRIIEVKHGTQ